MTKKGGGVGGWGAGGGGGGERKRFDSGKFCLLVFFAGTKS